MSQHIRTFIVCTTLSLFLIVPSSALACGTVPDSQAYFDTPIMAKGRFVYVQRISKRTLKNMITVNQQLYRPIGMKMAL